MCVYLFFFLDVDASRVSISGIFQNIHDSFEELSTINSAASKHMAKHVNKSAAGEAQPRCTRVWSPSFPTLLYLFHFHSISSRFFLSTFFLCLHIGGSSKHLNQILTEKSDFERIGPPPPSPSSIY